MKLIQQINDELKQSNDQITTDRATEQADIDAQANWGKVTPVDESLADLAKGKGESVKTNYPKTNLKRYIDQWNEKLGKWVSQAHRKGNAVKKRVSMKSGAPTILDSISPDGKLISTAVVTGHDDMKSGDFTFDFYNQADEHAVNKYRIDPAKATYTKDWNWEMLDTSGLHHSDTRNVPTSNNPTRDMKNGRSKDADLPSWANVITGKNKQK